jgi:3'-phosphoadenosine 5'-phosphosulfate (PAPS) 3'-phosphatase
LLSHASFSSAVAADDKADGSSATLADREASAHVLKRLNAPTPDYGVISEEERVSYLPGARWPKALLQPPYGFPVRQPMLVEPPAVVEKLIRALAR